MLLFAFGRSALGKTMRRWRSCRSHSQVVNCGMNHTRSVNVGAVFVLDEMTQVIWCGWGVRA